MVDRVSYVDTLNRLGLAEPAEIAGGHRPIHRAMSSLSDAHRIALVLTYFYGYTRAEVASVLDLPLSGVTTGIQLGLRDLRAQVVVIADADGRDSSPPIR